MDDAKNQPTKSKLPRQSRPFAIDFVVPMQLEECIQRLEKDTSQNRFKIRHIGESDRVAFLIQTNLTNDIFVTGQGTFQRWQGTSIRVRGSMSMGAVPRFIVKSKSLTWSQKLLIMFWVVATSVLVIMFSAYYPIWSFPQLAVMICCLLVFLPISLEVLNRFLIYRQRRIFIRHLRQLLTADR